MVLNAYGKIAYERMEWLADRYCYVDLHSFIIMPNHVHAIIEINSLKVVDEGMKIKSLSELMGAYKTTSSKLIHLAGYSDFKWQRSFHDHIIRNERAYMNISTYIVTNAERWRSDTFFN
jgi:REP element-mobilizing transposase RayT